MRRAPVADAERAGLERERRRCEHDGRPAGEREHFLAARVDQGNAPGARRRERGERPGRPHPEIEREREPAPPRGRCAHR
jgi:hypothetical protein